MEDLKTQARRERSRRYYADNRERILERRRITREDKERFVRTGRLHARLWQRCKLWKLY